MQVTQHMLFTMKLSCQSSMKYLNSGEQFNLSSWNIKNWYWL